MKNDFQRVSFLIWLEQQSYCRALSQTPTRKRIQPQAILTLPERPQDKLRTCLLWKGHKRVHTQSLGTGKWLSRLMIPYAISLTQGWPNSIWAGQ
jgi:hypothetical protein